MNSISEENKDVRWQQRLQNFSMALISLRSAVELSFERPLSDLEQQGLIQAFEFTHELAWNLLKDFLESRGATALYGSRDTSREAFKRGLIENGEIWMNMILSRNRSSHTYQKSTADEIATQIKDLYLQEFLVLEDRMTKLRQEDQ